MNSESSVPCVFFTLFVHLHLATLELVEFLAYGSLTAHTIICSNLTAGNFLLNVSELCWDPLPQQGQVMTTCTKSAPANTSFSCRKPYVGHGPICSKCAKVDWLTANILKTHVFPYSPLFKNKLSEPISGSWKKSFTDWLSTSLILTNICYEPSHLNHLTADFWEPCRNPPSMYKKINSSSSGGN